MKDDDGMTAGQAAGNQAATQGDEQENEAPPTFLQITMSVMAAAFGVQSDKNRKRDFSQGSPLPYIVGGIIFTVLFILAIVSVVALVLPD